MLNEPLYTQCHIVDPNSLDDLRYHASQVGSFDAGVKQKGNSNVDYGARKARIKNIQHTDYPDICQSLLELLGLHRKRINPNEYEVLEFNYLKYEIGGHFIKHHDVIPASTDSNNGRLRIYSTITLLDKSDNLEGGELLLFSDEQSNEPTIITLERNETVLFASKLFHMVTPITQGTRDVLVSWIYQKNA